MLLALDLGTRTGWALRLADGRIVHGWVDLKGGRYEGGGMRFLRFQRWLDELHSLHAFPEVIFEEVRRHLGVDAAHVYGGLLATLTTWCESKDIAYRGIPVATIKRAACGKGNATKAEVIGAVRGWGHPVTDDNEADALALLKVSVDG